MKQPKVKKVDGEFQITYLYSPQIISDLQRVKGKKRRGNVIYCPTTKENKRTLTKLGWYKPKKKKRNVTKTSPSLDLDFPNGLHLRPYQEQAVLFLDRVKKALLADDMGLGKTPSCVGWAVYRKDVRPILVVCPSCAKEVWYEEFKKWAGIKAYICEGKTPKEIDKDYEVVIINYTILSSWQKTLQAFGFKVCIADEGHYLKNYKAQRTKAFKKIAAYKPYKFIVTGTPVENRPIEFFTICQMLLPGHPVLSNYWKFVNRYCNPKNRGGFIDYSGASNTEELHKILTETIMLRRMKSEVLQDLPSKQKNLVPIRLEASDWKKYQKAEKETASAGDISHLRQLLFQLMKKQCFEWIDNLLMSGEKVLVFVWHKQVADDVYNHYKKVAVRYTGNTSKKDKEKAKDLFQNGNKQLFVGNIKACGVALTLTACCNAVFIEYPWSPKALDQAEDRIYRFGQKRKVNIWYLYVRHTIIDTMLSMLEEKDKVLNTILDGEDGENRGGVLTEKQLWIEHSKRSKQWE